MERAVKEEFKKTLIPAVKTSMEPVKNIVQTELSQKLTTTDHALRESVSKMVRSRQAVEAIGQAAGQALQAPIQVSQKVFHFSMSRFALSMFSYLQLISFDAMLFLCSHRIKRHLNLTSFQFSRKRATTCSLKSTRHFKR